MLVITDVIPEVDFEPQALRVHRSFPGLPGGVVADYIREHVG